MVKIAFLGTGIMGREMVLKLLEARHDVTVYNRTAARAKPLVKAGAKQAPTPAAAAAAADFVISMVSDDEASRGVWLGPDGVLAGKPKPNAIAVESSTLSRGWILELDEILRKEGLRFIDCPVTGGSDGARQGTLTLLAGGDAATLHEAAPVLAAYSNRVIHFGPVGTGTVYKLIVNLMGAAQATALAEGLLLAESAGLDLETVGEALRTGTVASPLVKYLTDRMVRKDHDDVYFSARLRYKDAAYGLELAAELGRAMPTSAVGTEIFGMALSKGLGEKNSSVVIETLR
jgi:3-hydroxyisobutyrate dehydrogenase